MDRIYMKDNRVNLSAYNKKDGDPIKLLKVRKNGYELGDKDLVGREMVFSSRVPIYK